MCRWINWIGALPCLALFDDDCLRCLFSTSTVAEATAAAAAWEDGASLAEVEEGETGASVETKQKEIQGGGGSGGGSSGSNHVQGQVPGENPPSTGHRGMLGHVCSGISRPVGYCAGRLYRTVTFIVHISLVFFILCKSAEPMKELFKPAPWLAYYDRYFFVNAQVREWMGRGGGGVVLVVGGRWLGKARMHHDYLYERVRYMTGVGYRAGWMNKQYE